MVTPVYGKGNNGSSGCLVALEYDGRIMSVKEWAAEYGISPKRLRERVRNGAREPEKVFGSLIPHVERGIAGNATREGLVGIPDTLQNTALRQWKTPKGIINGAYEEIR